MKLNEFYAIKATGYNKIIPSLGLHYNKQAALKIAKSQHPTMQLTHDSVVKVAVVIEYQPETVGGGE